MQKEGSGRRREFVVGLAGRGVSRRDEVSANVGTGHGALPLGGNAAEGVVIEGMAVSLPCMETPEAAVAVQPGPPVIQLLVL